ncbi:MAG: zinc ribbon domain-containing protein [Candidatus Brocadiaceae bacterium]
MSALNCPKCGASGKPGENFCRRCGAPLEREEEGPGIPAPLYWFLNLFPGLVRPSVLVMSILAMGIAVPVGWLGMFLFLLGAVFSGVAVLGFALLMYGTGWVWLLYGYICLPSEALAEFDGTRWTVFMLLVLAPICVLFALAGAAGGG